LLGLCRSEMKSRTIKFVTEFTDTPGGRYRLHGDFSGEQFREEVLAPALRDFDEVVLDLNGAFGFPSSFIDEAFGILVEKIGLAAVNRKLRILLDDDDVALHEIEQSMREHKSA